jgi:hypothetical protein
MIMKGYKGFDKDMKCRDFQFKSGETYTHEGDVILCGVGFHFVENPLDVFDYYDPAGSRYSEVDADGVDDKQDADSKRVCKTIKIGAEIGLSGIISAGVKFILEKVDFINAPATNTDYSSAATNTGYSSAATNTGYSSAATNTGYRSAATNTGDRSAATNTGEEGCAISLGIEGKARGELGCWLTLAEWSDTSGEWHRIDVQTRKVDGVEIKADTFYRLVGGKFVEVQA